MSVSVTVLPVAEDTGTWRGLATPSPWDPGAGPRHSHPESATRLRLSLIGLRDPGSVDELIQRVPSAVFALGFDRVVYSHVDGRRWTPVAECPSVGPGDAVVMSTAGYIRPAVDQPSDLFARQSTCEIRTSFPEHELLGDPRPLRVTGAPAGRGLVLAWRSAGYVVAPVVQFDRVVGLVHADCPLQGRLPDQLDQELLGVFAEALAAALAGAQAVDSLRAMRARMTLLAAEFDHPSRTEAAVVGPPAVPDSSLSLTRREREVLELVAAGQTNRQIARRLVITEGTAKSHVKRILRKLQAANRAEAVAAWVRTFGAPSPGW